MRRRQLLGGAGIALTTATAGCLGFITGEQSLSFAAEPAVAAESTVGETDYETEGPQARTQTREFTVAGQTREVEVTNRITTYQKTVDNPLFGEARLAVFAAISSPKVTVAGQTLNPVEDYSNEKLVSLLTSQYEGLDEPTRVDGRTVRTLGSDVELDKFEATATVDGQEVDVYIHVGRTEHEDDFVIPMGMYPKRRESEERPTVVSLTESLEHPA
ncbi:DUF6517 family protein [Halorarum halobium]|uniref:DUF6517 family protein n=1 Tax=Halorarum halobium TaxID=3075121 RepID=UPI0028AA6553|nr:DUF6517 family protein [Halobaculum sp. XH14]